MKSFFLISGPTNHIYGFHEKQTFKLCYGRYNLKNFSRILVAYAEVLTGFVIGILYNLYGYINKNRQDFQIKNFFSKNHS